MRLPGPPASVPELSRSIHRRSALATLFVAVTSSPSLPAFADTKYDGPPALYKTKSGIVFYDTDQGFDIPRSMKLSDVLAQEPVAAPPEVNPPGTRVILNYRVRSNALTGDIMEASDSIGLGQPGSLLGIAQSMPQSTNLSGRCPRASHDVRSFLPNLNCCERIKYRTTWKTVGQ